MTSPLPTAAPAPDWNTYSWRPGYRYIYVAGTRLNRPGQTYVYRVDGGTSAGEFLRNLSAAFEDS